MTNSTKRALRTAIQVLVAVATLTPLLLTVLKGTPVEAQVGILAAWIAVLAKVINAAEDAGLIPAWLKDSTPVPVPVVPAEVTVTLPVSADNPVTKAVVKKAPAKKAAAKKTAAPKE